MKARVQVHGLARVTRQLKAFDEGVAEEVKGLNLEAAEMVATTARPLAPIRNGSLQESIRAGATQRTGYVAAGSASVPYAPPIHFGWPKRNIEPSNFLYDALGQRQDQIVDDYERGISGVIQRFGF